MPVRSSICTYSPASSSKHSSISSLSIGHYKPLSSTSYNPSSTTSTATLSSKYAPPPPRISTYTSYTPLSSSGSSPTSRYRPLTSSSQSPSRYSTSSSTSSSGISSLSSSNQDHHHNYGSNYSHTSSSPSALRRLSYTVSLLTREKKNIFPLFVWIKKTTDIRRFGLLLLLLILLRNLHV